MEMLRLLLDTAADRFLSDDTAREKTSVTPLSLPVQPHERPRTC